MRRGKGREERRKRDEEAIVLTITDSGWTLEKCWEGCCPHHYLAPYPQAFAHRSFQNKSDPTHKDSHPILHTELDAGEQVEVISRDSQWGGHQNPSMLARCGVSPSP